MVGVLFVDLDDFKVVNDTLGHGAGDELLVAVAARLAARRCAPRDTAARLGGDEFAVLIEDAADAAEVERGRGADRRRALAEPVRRRAASLVTASASVGVATTADARGAAELLRQADLALYVAKGAGKGRWRRYEPGLHTAAGRAARAADRRWTGRSPTSAFVLRYQPIVDLRTGAIGRLRGAACAGTTPTAGMRAARRVHRRGRGERADRAARRAGCCAGAGRPAARWRATSAPGTRRAT